MKSVIFLSPPAAGKGTFSDYLINKYSYQHISTGNILREKAKKDKELNNLLKSGVLINDETIMEILKEKLEIIDKDKPYILDGIPRTLHQAKVLDIIINDLGTDYIVINIEVDKEILEKRVTGRRICPKCNRSYNLNIIEYKPKLNNICDVCKEQLQFRVDDSLEAYNKRYENYLELTYPLISYYQQQNKLVTIKNNDVVLSKALEELERVLND